LRRGAAAISGEQRLLGPMLIALTLTQREQTDDHR
jgi:hypothetical protein